MCEKISQGDDNDSVWTTPINIVVNHDKPSLSIGFGTTLKNSDNLECMARFLKQGESKKTSVFGLDDVNFYIK